ncbi:hypothetical protein NMG60_11023294 [Bertholletia excelsa]
MSNPQLVPFHLCFFLLVLFMFASISWYADYESIFEGLFDQIKLAFVVSPFILLLAIHLLVNFDNPFFMPLSKRDSFHRASGTPWGVGFLLVLLFFMISY